jgi:hypothetical protein
MKRCDACKGAISGAGAHGQVVGMGPRTCTCTEAERAILADVRVICNHSIARLSNGMTPEITLRDVRCIEQLADAFANALARQ